MEIGSKTNKEGENQGERNWLVKSSNKILGPFNFNEIVELLQKRQISIIDEVRRSNVRWGYIREKTEFLSVVQSLRDESDLTSENTMTTTGTLGTSGGTVTMTRTDPHRDSGSSYGSTFEGGDSENLRDVSANIEAKTDMGESIKIFGSAKDQRLQNSLAKKYGNILIGIFVLIIAVIAALALGMYKKSRDKNSAYEDLTANAIRFKNMGLYSKSLEVYKKSLTIREPSSDLQNQMAIVLIAQDNQVVAGRRVLDVVVQQEGVARSALLDAFLTVGLSYLLEGELKLSEESFQKAAVIEPNNSVLLLNLALIEIKKNKLSKALSDLDLILKTDRQNALAQIARAVAAIELFKQKNLNLSVIKQIYFDLKEYKNSKSFLRQEASILMATIAHLLNEPSEVPKALDSFFDLPYNDSTQYVHNIYLDWRIASWKTLERYVKELYSSYKELPIVGSVMAMVYLAEGMDIEANSLMVELQAQFPNNSNVTLAQAESLFKAEKYVEMGVLLRKMDSTKFALSPRLQGEVCQRQNDLNCLETNVQILQQMDARNLFAYHMSAYLLNKHGDKTKALEKIKDGLAEQSNYIPMIQFRDNMELGIE